MERSMGIHPVRQSTQVPDRTSYTFTSDMQEYRKISPQDTGSSSPKFDYDYIIPIVDPSSLDLRCGRNASKAWSKPKTAIVHAGDTVGFSVNTTVGLPIQGAPVNPWDVRYNLTGLE